MQYKVGMYGGCFNPLHKGHLNCIIKAACMCEELYVVLSCSINRNEIDERIRYRWLYQLTKHIGNVKLIIIRDETYTKEEYTEEASKKDTEYIKKTIGKPIDVVFCGSDYDKNSFWGKNYPESELIIFERDGVSSTEIRKNPYKHWDELPNIVKTFYNKKILIAGIESSGKTVMTINLANYFNTNYILEAGRELSEKSGTDMMMLPIDFTEILLQQKLDELHAIENSNKFLFCDTDCLYTRFFLDFLDSKEKEKNILLADAIDNINSYDLIIFLEPVNKWEIIELNMQIF